MNAGIEGGVAHLSVHCSGGRMASVSVTLVLSSGFTPGPVWFTARLANSTSYSTQLKRKVVNVTTNRNCLEESGPEKYQVKDTSLSTSLILVSDWWKGGVSSDHILTFLTQ